MTIQLFDLADQSDRIFFSPYCWRTRMALKHKGLNFESLPWHFTEKDRLEPSDANGRVPLIIDGDKRIHDSWKIALYLDKTYADGAALFPDQASKAVAKFVETWAAKSLFPTLVPLCVIHVFAILPEKDKSYFRTTREKALGTTLETISKDPAAEKAAFNTALAPLETMLTESPFFGGDQPNYADYVVFGSLMWPYTICPDNPIAPETNVAAWFERLLDLHDGFARNARRAATR